MRDSMDPEMREVAATKAKDDLLVKTAIDAKRLLLLFQEHFQRLLGDQKMALRFVTMACIYVQQQPELSKCDQMSFVLCLMQIAELGLFPGPASGHAYLIPFGDKNRGPRGPKVCTLIPGYKGYVHCMYRHPSVADVFSAVVREGDDFSYELGTDRWIKHRPAAARGKITHAYTAVELTESRRPIFRVLDLAEIEHYRSFSRAKNSGPWTQHFEAMAMKTAARRVTPWVPLSYEAQRLVELDRSEDEEPGDVKRLGAAEWVGEGDEEEEKKPPQKPQPKAQSAPHGREPGDDEEYPSSFDGDRLAPVRRAMSRFLEAGGDRGDQLPDEELAQLQDDEIGKCIAKIEADAFKLEQKKKLGKNP